MSAGLADDLLRAVRVAQKQVGGAVVAGVVCVVSSLVSQVCSTRIGMTRRGLDEVVRASPHYSVTPEEINQALDRIGGIVSRVGR